MIELDDTARVLTLTQPWASLVAAGAKTIETRGWTTRWRGPLLVRSALTFPKETPRSFCAALCKHTTFSVALSGAKLDDLPLGKVVAVTRVLDIVPIEDLRYWTVREREFGDFSPGRFAWMLDRVTVLAEPVEAPGGQGLRKLSDETAELVEAALREQDREGPEPEDVLMLGGA